LKVTPITAIGKAIKSKNPTHRFVGPYQTLRKIGLVAYQVSLPHICSNLHDVFLVYVSDPSRVIMLDTIQLKDDLTFKTMHVQIVDRKIKLLRGKQILLVKIIWNKITGDVTWELEEKIRKGYPRLFE